MRWSCPGCQEILVVTPARTLPLHDDPEVGVQCQGTGLHVDRALYMQYVELFGLRRADEIVQREQENKTAPNSSPEEN